MYKTIILLTSLAILIGCSSKPKVEVEKKVKKVVVDQNKTTKKDVEPKEFVPRHIILSHIEVVPH